MADETTLLRQLEAELASARDELARRRAEWTTQLQIAARVHASLLPQPARYPRIDIDTRCVSVDGVGGDYCQVLFPSESCCYVTMCDVTGHGIGPALLATRVSSEVRRLVWEQLRPMEIVQSLNTFIFRHFLDTHLPVSFFAGRIDFEGRTITHSGAGHPGPLLIRRACGSIEVLESQNTLIGVVEESLGDRPEDTHALHPGDRLLFFTDGLSEARDTDGMLLGTDGLARLARLSSTQPLFSMADHLLDQVAAFRSGPPHDDMMLIIGELK